MTKQCLKRKSAQIESENYFQLNLNEQFIQFNSYKCEHPRIIKAKTNTELHTSTFSRLVGV